MASARRSTRPGKAAAPRGLRFLAPFHVQFVDDLHSSRRELYAGGDVGSPVHAASFVHRRLIVLDRELLRKRRELKRIVIHELFHFAWIRLGNPRRREWELLLAAERRLAARGELGWSAEWRKRELTGADPLGRTRNWREYACESFCDTAAWLLAGARPHPEVTLAARHRLRRAAWFVELFRQGCVTI